MSDPSRTPVVVVPRATRPGGEAALPLDRLVGPVLSARGRGLVVVTAPPGGGKTTAALHLRATLPTAAVFDEHQSSEAIKDAGHGWAVLLTVAPLVEPVATFALRPWDADDRLEYLVARHRPACAAVLRRLAVDSSVDLLDGSPQLTAMVLDAMAADPSCDTVRDALRQHAWRTVPPGPALDALMTTTSDSTRPIDAGQRTWWRHDGYQRVCTADWIADRLAHGVTPIQMTNARHYGGRADEIAAAARLRPAAVTHLARLVSIAPTEAIAASVLLAIDPAWRPTDGRGLYLAGARLAGARWAGLDLTDATLAGADLRGADLSAADLTRANANGADLTAARLTGAKLPNAKLIDATLAAADLSGVAAAGADWSGATLAGADLRGADLTGGRFRRTDLTRVRATRATFDQARFESADWAGADFTFATFRSAELSRSDLTTAAAWAGASFAGARLHRCRLEGLDLPRADFAGADLSFALLTGSHLPGGRFGDADLRHAGLAEVDWTGADLRGADLTAASVHLGSTRSGLIGVGPNLGPPHPMEGSMTGFYADDRIEEDYRPPEEIRTACLRAADLTGATVDRTDFYRVDLRDATCTADQRAHFARTGAILS